MPWCLYLAREMQIPTTKELVLMFLLPDAKEEFQVFINVQFNQERSICLEEEFKCRKNNSY